MKLNSLTFIAMLIANVSFAMPMKSTFDKLSDKDHFGSYDSGHHERIEFIPSKHYQIVNDYFLTNNSFLSSIMFEFGSDLPPSVPASSELDETLPIAGVTYARLPEIDFEGSLKTIEPVLVSQTELMIAMTEFSISPLEAENQLTIGFSYLSNTEVRIFNDRGELVTKILNSDLEKVMMEINISHFSPGYYSASDSESTIQFYKK